MKGNGYLVVARRKRWTLCYPRHLWEGLSDRERGDVVDRQQRLFDKMERRNGAGLGRESAPAGGHGKKTTSR